MLLLYTAGFYYIRGKKSYSFHLYSDYVQYVTDIRCNYSMHITNTLGMEDTLESNHFRAIYDIWSCLRLQCI